jgi:hypothetical protein
MGLAPFLSMDVFRIARRVPARAHATPPLPPMVDPGLPGVGSPTEPPIGDPIGPGVPGQPVPRPEPPHTPVPPDTVPQPPIVTRASARLRPRQ